MTQPRILGLDLSLTGTGVSCAQCGESVITTKKVGAEERLVLIRDMILTEHLGDLSVSPEHSNWHADLVVLEGYAFSRPNQAHQIGELGGIIRVMLYEAHVPWVAIPPKRLKKWATDNGNANKDEMLSAAIRNFGYEGSNNNEADAFLLRRLAEAHYAGDEQFKYRQVIDEDIDWPVLDASELRPVP